MSVEVLAGNDNSIWELIEWLNVYLLSSLPDNYIFGHSETSSHNLQDQDMEDQDHDTCPPRLSEECPLSAQSLAINLCLKYKSHQTSHL